MYAMKKKVILTFKEIPLFQAEDNITKQHREDTKTLQDVGKAKLCGITSENYLMFHLLSCGSQKRNIA